MKDEHVIKSEVIAMALKRFKALLFLFIFSSSLLSQNRGGSIGVGLFYDQVFDFTLRVGISLNISFMRNKYMTPEFRFEASGLSEALDGFGFSFVGTTFIYHNKFYLLGGVYFHKNIGVYTHWWEGDTILHERITYKGVFKFVEFGIGSKLGIFRLELVYQFPLDRKVGYYYNLKYYQNLEYESPIYIYGIFRTFLSIDISL